MARFGFVGASYTSQSPNADDELCENFYVEQVESSGGKSPLVLYSSPGLSKFCTLPGNSVSELFTFNGRAFGVSGTSFCEINSNKTASVRGPVKAPTTKASMTAGPNQILVCSGGILYVFDLTSNILATVDMSTLVGAVSKVAYCDGFFVALIANSNKFEISSPDDAMTWSPGNVGEVSVFADNLVSMEVIYRQLFFLGNKRSQVYYDSGAPLFPFDVVQGGFIEQGAASVSGITLLDNSLFWVGQDERGSLIAWRANGYTPQRVSTHAVEFAWQKYPTASDVITYAFQDQGHTFWHVYFPTANKSWRYDAATGLWHEVSFGTSAIGRTAHRSQCHTFAFGQHLVGDWASGNVYQMSIANLDDFGNPMRRARRAPLISSENQWIYHDELEIDLETGLGPQPPLRDGQGNPRDPQVCLRWSDDGGHTWSNEHWVGAGQTGKYKTRVMYRRLGRSRYRIYEMVVTDPIPWRIVDSYIRATPGFAKPTERIASQLRKVS